MREKLYLRGAVAFAVFIGAAVYFLWAEHRAHIMGALPYVLLLACVAAHLLVHSGRTGRNGGAGGGHLQAGHGGRS